MTANVRTIRTVPLRLTGDDVPATVELRGEVYFPLSAFDRLNREREAEGLPLYVNPRNTASGALRQLDSRVTASRPLDVTFYSSATRTPPSQTAIGMRCRRLVDGAAR